MHAYKTEAPCHPVTKEPQSIISKALPKVRQASSDLRAKLQHSTVVLPYLWGFVQKPQKMSEVTDRIKHCIFSVHM